ncbi:hypothetical protein [Companilactobacillus mishanensis]|uniref:Transcriptional regulator n=1 Tax=Companilactobacillus mishanensis TaxID=2486008 RepID=A0A5P0ZGH7_9LACO|nr:hypothetical protein [Companilactobacillus mishanensis]
MSGIEKLRKATLKYLEQLLEDYQTIDDEIARRLLVIDSPWVDHDTNVGGGRSSFISRQPETIAFKHMDDVELQNKLKLKEDCHRAVEIYQEDEQQYQMYLYRFKSSNYYSWNEIADLMYMSKTLIYRKRYQLLKVLADIKGIKE